LERELLQRLNQAESHIRELENQFKEYQEMVRKTFLDDATAKQIINEDAIAVRSSPALADHQDDGNYYFNSYAQNGELDTMMKEKARFDVIQPRTHVWCYRNSRANVERQSSNRRL
jgi:hypothetical protein